MSNRSLMRAAEPRGIIGTQLKVWTAGFSSETVAPSLSIHTQSYNCLRSRQQCLKHPSSNRSCGAFRVLLTQDVGLMCFLVFLLGGTCFFVFLNFALVPTAKPNPANTLNAQYHSPASSEKGSKFDIWSPFGPRAHDKAWAVQASVIAVP